VRRSAVWGARCKRRTGDARRERRATWGTRPRAREAQDARRARCGGRRVRPVQLVRRLVESITIVRRVHRRFNLARSSPVTVSLMRSYLFRWNLAYADVLWEKNNVYLLKSTAEVVLQNKTVVLFLYDIWYTSSCKFCCFTLLKLSC
jgi:hypothetical protein